MLHKALADYAAYGITTAQDGATSPTDITAMRAAARRQPFPIDVVSYRAALTLGANDLGTFKHDSFYKNGSHVSQQTSIFFIRNRHGQDIYHLRKEAQKINK